MSKNVRWFLALSGGLLLGLSFPPFPFPWLAWVALIPLIKALDGLDWRTAAALSISSFVVATLLAGHWVLLHADPYTRMASAAGMFWIALLSALPYVAAAKSSSVVQHRITIVIGVAAVELFHLYTQLGFPWLLLGHTQANFEPFNQVAQFGGVTLLSIWILAINFATLELLASRRPTRYVPLLTITVLIGVPALTGIWSLDRFPAKADSIGGLHIVGIQPSLPVDLWQVAEDTRRKDSLMTLTRTLMAETDSTANRPIVIVWPETVLPPRNRATHHDTTLLQLKPAFADYLLTGGIDSLQNARGSPYRNTVYLIGQDRIETFHKRRLVPFAEHVPYSDRLPVLSRLAVPSGGVWGYRPGQRMGLFDLADIDVGLGVLVCFESVFGQLSRELAEAGASVLIVVTQDGWWGDSFGYRQHLAFSRLRAIETRLPVIQVAATGISAHIDRTGRVVDQMGWMERGMISATMSTEPSETLYIAFGDWPAVLSLVLGLFLILSARFRRTGTT